jgi:hypothetical protein
LIVKTERKAMEGDAITRRDETRRDEKTDTIDDRMAWQAKIWKGTDPHGKVRMRSRVRDEEDAYQD